MDRERATEALAQTRDAALLLGRALFLQSRGAAPAEVLEACEEATLCLYAALQMLTLDGSCVSAVPWVQEAELMAHHWAVRFAVRFPPDERREWAYRKGFAWALGQLRHAR